MRFELAIDDMLGILWIIGGNLAQQIPPLDLEQIMIHGPYQHAPPIPSTKKHRTLEHLIPPTESLLLIRLRKIEHIDHAINRAPQ